MFLSKVFCLLFAVLFLVSCSHQSADKTAVTGLCRSCKPYYERGSWHYPQKYYEYSEEGLASWYGPRFHNKLKASGQRFNQHDLNAAHRTLPLPTIVRVTNLENNKSVVVLVDDRGPYVYTGRIIDLSMGAAKAIGCYQKGLARVRVESMVEDSKALADYLAKHRMGKEHLKRTWQQIYEQEIKGMYLGTPLPIEEPPLFQKTSQAKKVTAKKLTAAQKKVNDNQHKTAKPYMLKTTKVFKDKANADSFAKKLQIKFPSRVVSEKDINGKRVWRVQAGPFYDSSKLTELRAQINRLSNKKS